MSFLPFDRMWYRVSIAREESDTSLFVNLLYFGEMILKLATAGLIANVSDDRQRHRYCLVYKLLRSDGIGDWVDAIDQTITGPTSQLLHESAREVQKELTQRCAEDSWQYKTVFLIHKVLKALDQKAEDLPSKLESKRWFSYFARIRNKSRGHGALQSGLCKKVAPDLEESIRIFVNNFALFKFPWAYLHRNLSGKYRVIKWNEDGNAFDPLRSSAHTKYCIQDGVHIHSGNSDFNSVELVFSNVDASDIYFPNGNFRERKYELLSYITGDIQEGDASSFLTPATDLPKSETQGLGQLDIQGKGYGNLPPLNLGYIHRESLEKELLDVLTNDRYRIVTLSGRGGIGKTWLALSVLHKIADMGMYTAIIWFSARDIDLLPEGPKPVSAQVLSEKDIAKEFIRLIQPIRAQDKDFKPILYFNEMLTKSNEGPILFVFDNFETMKHPIDLYNILDTYVRLPNKILITTRVRGFKADYPVEVKGMSESESRTLVQSESKKLNISKVINEEYIQEIMRESEGHPYVIKILLGEVAKAGKMVKIDRIVASKDDILDALFDRTYNNLTPVSKRIFLTLSGWRSAVPQLALEAVLLRPENDRMEVDDSIEELRKSSFIEVIGSYSDDSIFLVVPLTATLFGRKKLAVSPMKAAIESDLLLLHQFGAIRQSDLHKGIEPRINRMFAHVATLVSKDTAKLKEYIPILQFIARKYPPAWLLIAKLYQEISDSLYLNEIMDAIRSYLETEKGDIEKLDAWMKLAEICKKSKDILGEMQALVEASELKTTPFSTISATANRLNELFKNIKSISLYEKQIIIKKLITIMRERIQEANAIDCSRLAWLYLNVNDEDAAKQIIEKGLRLEPDNEYCQKLAERLSIT